MSRIRSLRCIQEISRTGRLQPFHKCPQIHDNERVYATSLDLSIPSFQRVKTPRWIAGQLLDVLCGRNGSFGQNNNQNLFGMLLLKHVESRNVSDLEALNQVRQ
mmetsp:Transcript_27299/g.40165  ORF Transcript_27299/g.40165 Transcript_27299/m.40165 type:complete len:104 (+) Transcript_27299:136-447(+)